MPRPATTAPYANALSRSVSGDQNAIYTENRSPLTSAASTSCWAALIVPASRHAPIRASVVIDWV